MPKGKKTVRFNIPEENATVLNQEEHHHLSNEEIAIRRNIQGTQDMFLYNYALPIEELASNVQYKINLKILNEYEKVKNMANPLESNKALTNQDNNNNDNDNDNDNDNNDIKSLPPPKKRKIMHNKNNNEKLLNIEFNDKNTNEINNNIDNDNNNILENDNNNNNNNDNDEITSIILPKQFEENINKDLSSSIISNAINNISNDKKGNDNNNNNNNELMLYNNSNTSQIAKRNKNKNIIQPVWHAPWKLYRILSGHRGWVKCIAVDPSNLWFATGSADSTIKIWDMASGTLKLSLTGHVSHVRGLSISSRHPYLFSVGEDKMVKCWDLEQNKVIRQYHGHLSGIYCCTLHPSIDILFTGSRDCTCRVWDIRSKSQIYVLTGHNNTICSMISQSNEPQIITGSHDHTIRCWDLKTGKTRIQLTHHKKSIRSLAFHPKEYTYASGAADNIKIWKCPESIFLRNMNDKPPNIIETLSVNYDNVLVSGHQNGIIKFWDWKSGYCFQTELKEPQPGSLSAEAGICCSTFDITGTRLITGEYDKTIKMWKEDHEANSQTHPINFKPNKQTRY